MTSVLEDMLQAIDRSQKYWPRGFENVNNAHAPYFSLWLEGLNAQKSSWLSLLALVELTSLCQLAFDLLRSVVKSENHLKWTEKNDINYWRCLLCCRTHCTRSHVMLSSARTNTHCNSYDDTYTGSARQNESLFRSNGTHVFVLLGFRTDGFSFYYRPKPPTPDDNVGLQRSHPPLPAVTVSAAAVGRCILRKSMSILPQIFFKT